MPLYFVERDLALNNLFTPEQLLATELLDRSCSVLASAGSGKTKTLVGRYIALLKKGVLPRSILTVTFTTEAAGQLRERILEEASLSSLSSSLQEEVRSTSKIGTLHSFCYKFIQQYGSESGLSSIEGIVSEFDLKSTFQWFYRDFLGEISPDALKDLLAHFSHRELEEIALAIFRQRHLFFSCLDLAQEAQAPDLGAKVISLLAKNLKPLFYKTSDFFERQGKFTFDDLEYWTSKILSESALIRTRLRSEIQHILVDEFQDTSPMQWQILRLLWGEKPNGLFIVGDPKQSIYRFRSAEPLLFEQASQLIQSREGTEILLNKNFRTHPTLIDFFNQVGAFLFRDSPFSWSEMNPGVEQSCLEEEVLPNGFFKMFFGEKEKTPRPELNNLEIKKVIEELKIILSTASSLPSIGILFRNSDRIREFSEALTFAQLPHACQKSLNLSKKVEALEIIAFLKSVLDPLDEVSLVGLLRSVYFGFSFESILEFSKKRKTTEEGKLEPLILALRREAPEKLTWFFSLLDLEIKSIHHCLQQLFFQTQTFPKNSEVLLSLLEVLGPLSQTVLEIQPKLDSFFSTEVFSSVASDELSHQAWGKKPIQLMTVHASKGLEFDHVFLVDTARPLPADSPPLLLQSGLPPGIRFWESDQKVHSGSFISLLEDKKRKEMEEARRVFYVAMTRARFSVTAFMPNEEALSYPDSSWAFFIKEGERELKNPLRRPLQSSTTLLKTHTDSSH